ncbi:MAG: cytochrome c biogenesis CcdA family protein [Spirochaetota bacterium]
MISNILNFLTHILELGPLLGLVAAFGWGSLSVLLSPCHLTSIPLIISYLAGAEDASKRKIAGIVATFSSGILLTVGLIGVITYSMGRLIGDLGSWGNYIVSAIFIIIGLYLIGLLKLSMRGINLRSSFKRDYFGALLLGLVSGFALGSCTFAYLAPILGIVFRESASNPGFAVLLIAFYAIGHTAVILFIGLLYRNIEEHFKWVMDESRSALVRKFCGFIIMAGGLYLFYQALRMTLLT